MELIQISEDSPVSKSTHPYKKGTIEYLKYEVLTAQPYVYSANEFFEEIHFNIRGRRNLKIETYSLKRIGLAKRYGWGIHINSNGKIGLIACESPKYEELLKDPNVRKSRACRNKKSV